MPNTAHSKLGVPPPNINLELVDIQEQLETALVHDITITNSQHLTKTMIPGKITVLSATKERGGMMHATLQTSMVSTYEVAIQSMVLV